MHHKAPPSEFNMLLYVLNLAVRQARHNGKNPSWTGLRLWIKYLFSLAVWQLGHQFSLALLNSALFSLSPHKYKARVVSCLIYEGIPLFSDMRKDDISTVFSQNIQLSLIPWIFKICWQFGFRPLIRDTGHLPQSTSFHTLVWQIQTVGRKVLTSSQKRICSSSYLIHAWSYIGN